MNFAPKAILSTFLLLSVPTVSLAQAPAAEKAPAISEAMQPLAESVKAKMIDVFVGAISKLQGGNLPPELKTKMKEKAASEIISSEIFQWDKAQLETFKTDPTIFKASADFLANPPAKDERSKSMIAAFNEQLEGINKDSKLADKLALAGIKELVLNQLEGRVKMRNIMLMRKLHLNLMEAELEDFSTYTFKEEELFTNLDGKKLAWKLNKAAKHSDPILISPEKAAGKFIVLQKDGAVMLRSEKELQTLLNK